MKILTQFSRLLRTGAILLFLLFFIGYDTLSPSFLIQQGIAHRILRFHVIANSDSEADQKVKLLVRNSIIAALRSEMKSASSSQEAEHLLETHLDEVEKAANTVLSQNGFSYQSKAEISWNPFPDKKYGDLSFPAGNYRALTVKLGNAEGHNWWCVLFPTLCFTDETYDVITEENKEEFRDLLTDEEYARISESADNRPGQESSCDEAFSDKPKVIYKSFFLRFLKGH